MTEGKLLTARWLWLLAFAACSPVGAEPPPPCADLEPESGQVGYRLREAGTRCEGFYVSRVGSRGSLELVGLVRGQLTFDAATRELQLRSPLPGQPVHIRGIGIPDKIYYRLDGVIPAGGSFRWSLAEAVRPGGLGPADIGLVGRLGTSPETYVPVVVGNGPAVLSMRGSDRYAWMKWRHGKTGDCRLLEPWRPLDPPALPGKPVEITLPETGDGTLCVEVAAQPAVGTNNLQRALWRIHAGS